MLLWESRDTGSYLRSYMVLDFSTHKLRIYPEEVELAQDVSTCKPDLEINCQYITKVGVSSTRPKTLNCFEIGTPNGAFFFSVDCTEEREEWIEALKKSSLRQGSAKQLVSALQQKQRAGNVGYQTHIVGGVVHRTPIPVTQPNEGSSTSGDLEAEKSSSPASSPGATAVDQQVPFRRSRGFPRILKAGHGIKLGAVMKNWKRRFFVLTEISMGYYKSIEETEPIKTIPVGEITSVASSKELAGKEHLFEVVTPSRTFYVQAETDAELQDWLKAFETLLKTSRSSQQPLAQQVRNVTIEDSDEDVGTLV